jgi:uncharacterized protein
MSTGHFKIEIPDKTSRTGRTRSKLIWLSECLEDIAVMKIRKPDWDYAAMEAIWCKKYPEFAQRSNVGSIGLPYLEPYLNTVMRCAQAQLGTDHPLNNDIALFCKQEASHYLEHEAFNKAIYRSGYEKLPEIENLFKEHFERLLRDKSLKFNCAYCLGFETLGPITASFWFEGLDDILEHCDPEVVKLWRWHLAEEYEHRTVAYDVYQALYGDYFYRCYGLYCFTRDWRELGRTAVRYLLKVDQKNMSPDEIALSRKRSAELKKREARFTGRRMLKALTPLHDPRKYPEPKGAAELLRSVPERA